MIEKIILDYVSAALSVPVEMEIPTDRPTRFVVLKRSGRGRENGLHGANLIADSYAESLLEASVLNEQVKTVLDDLDSLDEISSAQLATDYPLTDTTSKRYRYQAVYEIYHY